MPVNQLQSFSQATGLLRQRCVRWLTTLSCWLCLSLASAQDSHGDWLSGPWQGPALGQPMSREAMKEKPRHVFADGTGLPAGAGHAGDGAELYGQLCASCHGSHGQGGKALELVGDRALLATDFPDRGIAAYWPNAPTLYEYVYRAMPPQNPAWLSADQVYAILAYVLQLNGLLAPGSLLDATALSAINMPNRDGFRTIAR